MSGFQFNYYQHLMLCIIHGLLYHSQISEQRYHGGSYRIINGTNAAITQFPYLVSIQRNSDGPKEHICGGAFISQKWVLTAAHCLIDETAKGLVIRAESSFQDTGGVLLRVAEIIKHEKFNPNYSKDYDYGLIRMSRAFPRAVVSRLKTGPKRYPPGQLCQVMGWGSTGNSKDSRRVKSISVPIIKQSICRSAYRRIDAITPRMLCAGYSSGEKDACEGDSGGPFICRGMLVGLTSWAEGCAEKGFYGVYSYITPVRGWIRNKTGV